MARSAVRKTSAITRHLGTHPQLRRLMWALSRLRTGQPLKTSEIRRWVLQFGHEAEVLAPKSLRKEVAAGSRATAGS